ncbi:MAG: hypothetical protein OIF48_13885 [Silicimonas sp.]|nr:hypothetical protein [Silicimonas sp.]
MKIPYLLPLLLAGCGGVAWNTTVADTPQVRQHMLASLRVGQTTETEFTSQWGKPTQKIHEGAQVSFIYRNMKNPKGFFAPQFGDSSAFSVVVFQYGLAVGGYSSDSQGCRATFAPRPPGPALDNPTTVHPVNCSGAGAAGRDGGSGHPLDARAASSGTPRTPADASRYITDQTYGRGKTPKPAPPAPPAPSVAPDVPATPTPPATPATPPGTEL